MAGNKSAKVASHEANLCSSWEAPGSAPGSACLHKLIYFFVFKQVDLTEVLTDTEELESGRPRDTKHYRPIQSKQPTGAGWLALYGIFCVSCKKPGLIFLSSF